MNLLNTRTQRTLDQVFQHPITHNLEWRDVKAMFEALGDVEQEHNGNMKVTLSGHAVVFQSPSDTKIASADQVSQIRRLLQNSGTRSAKGTGPHLLLVIDHKEARIYHTEMNGAIPEDVTPYDPQGTKGHVHSTHDQPGHKELPHNDAYYQPIATSLQDAEQILVFGSGGGSSNAMDTFVSWLSEHHQKLSDRIIGSVTIDQSHLTEGQLLAKAREIYAR